MSEEIREAREIVQTLIKAKKALRMYPQNNPVYQKTLDDSHERFKEFFDHGDVVTLKIKQNSVLYDTEEIYHNPEKEDNLALFFFKDGLRELTFKRGLSRDELEDFLRIIALDFDREALDDDVVTLLWEKDFQNIDYVVDEAYLVDPEAETYEQVVETKLREKVTDVNDLMRAYADGFTEEDVKSVSIVPLADKDLQMLVKELERDASDKVDKLVTILFELIYMAERKADIEEAATFIKDALAFSMKHGNIETVVDVMRRTSEIGRALPDDEKKHLKSLANFLGSNEVVGYLAEVLDGGIEIEEKVLEEFVAYLEKNAIEPLVKYLGELKTIRARKSVIQALIVLGKKDIQAVAKALDDERWYVVRNIIYVLRKIGDRRATEYLLRTIRHGDIRVRKEGIRTLGELGAREVIPALRECLSDPDSQIRIAAAKAFGGIGSEASRRVMLDQLASKEFRDREFEEKKEFFEVLVRWKDQEVFDFLTEVLKTKSFFNRAKMVENKACAAFTLGLLGNKDALPLLYKMRDSSNKLLSEFSGMAIKKLEYGT
ncbi:MAG: HEAT repeat domain-containing protein [Nitrospirota bacterium]